MGSLNFDFSYCPVSLTVSEALRRCDKVLSKLGARRSVWVKRVINSDGIIDVDQTINIRANTLEEADDASSQWLGREHFYRYPTPNKTVDISLCVWKSRLGCNVTATLERPDMRILRNFGDPFAALGSACATLSTALGAEWGLMRVDDDLAELCKDDLERWRSNAQGGLGDPPLGWIATDALARWPKEQREHPSFRVLKTNDGYSVMLHQPTITWFEDNL